MRGSTSPLFMIVVAVLIVLGALLVLQPIVRPLIGLRAGGNPGESTAEAVLLRFPPSEAIVIAELARSEAERQHGLMGRQQLEDGAGMLFIFPATTTGGFWMKDTPVPLSIAFIDEGRAIVDILDLQPLDETPRYSARPYRYALEVPQGWFARAGIQIGQRVDIPDELPEPASR